MGDFIGEIRPKVRPVELPEGFVAEMRVSSRRGASYQACCPLSPCEATLEPLHQGHDDDGHQLVMDLLSKMSSSREKVRQVLTSSMVTLIQRILTGHSISSIKGSVKIAFTEVEDPILVNLNEIFSPAARDAEKDLGITLKVPTAHSDVDVCHFDGHFYPEQIDRDYCRSIESSPPRADLLVNDNEHGRIASPNSKEANLSPVQKPTGYSPQYNAIREECGVHLFTSSDSDGESGYTSNDKDELSEEQGRDTRIDEASTDEVPLQESYFSTERVSSPEQSAGSRHNSVTDTHVDRAMEDDVEDEDDSEQRLVIDFQNRLERNTVEGENESNTAAPTVTNKKLEVDCTESVESDEYVNATETEDGENHTDAHCSDSGDAEIPMDFSGDCAVPLGCESPSAGRELLSAKSVMLSCKYCLETLPDTPSLYKHTLQSHQLHMCNYCYRAFTAKNNLKRHVRIHTGLRPYKCSQCSMTFARRDDLKGHTLRHDYTKPFRCSVCQKGYTDRACVKNHMVKEHGSRLLRVCPQCGESFDHEETYLNHKKSHPELSQYACDTCPFIGSNHLMAFKHSLLHSHKLFSCKPCNAYFADPFDYTTHVKKHKKSKTFKTYVCCFCEMALPTYEQYIRHEYSHAHGNLYLCKFCQKQFRTKSAMHDHVANHRDLSAASSMTSNEAPARNSKDVVIQNETCHLTSGMQQDRIPIDQDASSETKTCTGEQAKETEFIDTVESDESRSNDTFDINRDVNVEKIDGEALDLTMKTTAVGRQLNDQYSHDAQTSQVGQANLPAPCVPRNGCTAAEICSPKSGECAPERIENHVDIGDHVEKRNTSFLPSPTNVQAVPMGNEVIVDVQGMNERNTTIISSSSRNASDDDKRPKLVQKSTMKSSGHDKIPLARLDRRFNPYALSPKIVDLASKFVLARGGLLLAQSSKSVSKSPVAEQMQVRADQHAPSSKTATLNDVPREMHDGSSISSSPVILGLSGKEYRNTGHFDQPSQTSDSTEMRYPPIKQEVLDSSSAENRPAASPEWPTSRNPRDAQNCEICSEKFASFSILESHSVVMHKRYLCEYCGKGFTSRPNRDRHVRFHTGERPYKCDLCDTAFHRGDDLKYHRTTRHPDASPFVCTRCSATFTWKRDLDRHIRHSKCKA